jgi:sugar (pentulose or hexulose) kinase
VSQEAVLGIDIGTSATKAVLARPDGAVIATARRNHALSIPRPGWAEHDAEQIWWADVVAVCNELAPLAGSRPRGVCVSGVGPCLLPSDENLRPLRPAILYAIDSRATTAIDELEEALGAETILNRSGSALASQAGVPMETIGACYGDALLAAIGVGLMPPDTDWSSTTSTVEPSAAAKGFYDELFTLYDDLYAETASTVHELAVLASRAGSTSAVARRHTDNFESEVSHAH